MALELGVYDVEGYPDGLIWSMSWQQFLGWLDYNSYEPFGPQREDFRFGMLASVVAEPNRDRKRRAKPYSPADFMFFIDKEEGSRKSGNEPGILGEEGFKKLNSALRESFGLPRKEEA